MFLNKIDDPRDNLEKARRMELAEFAAVHRVTEITQDMPAILMRKILRSKGLTQIPAPSRPLGNQNQPHVRPMYKNGLAVPQAPARALDQPKVVESDATDDLARQYRSQPARPPKYPRRLVERPKSKINQMRDYCKEHGIKMDRRDRMPDLERKIEAHKSGQDAPQLRQ